MGRGRRRELPLQASGAPVGAGASGIVGGGEGDGGGGAGMGGEASQSSWFLGDEKYMTDCHFVSDEPPVNSSTKFNST